MKRHSDLCRQLVFANIIMIHVIMAIVLFHGLVRPVRMLAWIGGLLTALVVVFDIVYAANGAENRLTVVAGRELYRDGQFLTADYADALARIRRKA